VAALRDAQNALAGRTLATTPAVHHNEHTATQQTEPWFPNETSQRQNQRKINLIAVEKGVRQTTLRSM